MKSLNQKLLKALRGDDTRYPHLLEERYPRVFGNLLASLEAQHIADFLQDLLMDKRGGAREGFPTEVAKEIFQLLNFFQEQGTSVELDAWGQIPEYKRLELQQFGYEFTPESFFKAVEEGDENVTQIFLSCGVDLEARDEREWTPLMVSSFNGNEAFALLLLKCGAKISVQDKNGYTPLHWAAFSGFTEVVKLLLDKGANANTQSLYGWTALMQAATRGHLLPCAYLIANHADVNLKSVDGWTALHKAANNGHTDIVKLLLSKGADRFAEYQDGTTPLDLATKAKHAEIIQLLSI